MRRHLRAALLAPLYAAAWTGAAVLAGAYLIALAVEDARLAAERTRRER